MTGDNRLQRFRLRCAPAGRGDAIAVVGLLAGLTLTSPCEAQSAGALHLHVVVVEMHDRLTPTPRYDIVKQHSFEIEISTDKRITETIANSDLTNGVAHQDPGGNRQAALGQDSGVAWRVKSANRLQRTFERNGLITVWDVAITPSHECSISVRMSLRPGLKVMHGKITGTETEATFNNWRVRHAECSIN